jgi:hypothetical protein
LRADCLLFDIGYFFAQNKLAAQATYVASPTNLYIRVRAEDNVTAIELEGHVTSALKDVQKVVTSVTLKDGTKVLSIGFLQHSNLMMSHN